MAVTHNLGFPRIGKQRELKFVLEDYWQGNRSVEELFSQTSLLRQQNWQYQADCNYVPVGDFSFYDHVLDMSFLLGNVPERVSGSKENTLNNYFRVARGSANEHSDGHCTQAGEMTQWFDTNYHYIVPEVDQSTEFKLNPSLLLAQIMEADAQGLKAKPVLIGPVTYLWLSKSKDDTNKLDLLDSLLRVYRELLALLGNEGVEWVQIDEPILATELSFAWKNAIEKSYYVLQTKAPKILLATYFGKLQDNIKLTCGLPIAGLHIDTISAKKEVINVIDWLPNYKILSLGVINGRNIWKTDLNALLTWLEPIANKLQDRLWLAPSCSLLHVPLDLNSEVDMDHELKNWLAFAVQKLNELEIIKKGINHGRESIVDELAENAQAIQSRQQFLDINNADTKRATQDISEKQLQRQSSYSERVKAQRKHLDLPSFPTTTIGSFPQTEDIRSTISQFKQGELDETTYKEKIQQEIKQSILQQEALGLDVLVHGEAERSDMVEYFAEHLEGCALSQHGWVQSYGSRCVKPPILFGNIRRSQAMTVEWTQYAQSLTDKPMKGMLTGPVTILNWSFVRDDQPLKETCYQLALAIRDEVLALEKANVNIIQIDEAALREGLPLRKSEWQEYLTWAVNSFRLSANGVKDETQIHTHMCYSEFNDIIGAIKTMDADVITIENSRSNMGLLDALDEIDYPNQIGPGVFDIHSPNIPSKEQVVTLMEKAAEKIPAEQLWLNPDCGLKTRQWQEVVPALKNMVAAAIELRQS